MKKLLLFTVVFVMFYSSFAVAESENPFDQMTDEEILICYELTMNQIKKRGLPLAGHGGIEGQMIEPGVYVVGEDLPAGNYYFEGVKDRYPASINVLSSLENRDYIMDVGSFGYGECEQTIKSGKILLEDGWFLEVVQGPVIIHIWEGIGID